MLRHRQRSTQTATPFPSTTLCRSVDKFLVVAIFVARYLVLGAIRDVWAMLILTLPFVFPVILALGFDPVWFGVFIVVMVEIALITPPIGINEIGNAPV